MKTVKTLLFAAICQFSFGLAAQTNHIISFNINSDEYNFTAVEGDTVTVINNLQAGDFSYGIDGQQILMHLPYIGLGDTICQVYVTYDNSVDYYWDLDVFRGSNPGIHFGIYAYRGYLGIDQISTDVNASIYPNPASDYLIIENDAHETFEIYDSAGKIVLKSDAKDLKIDVSQLKPGTYLSKIGLKTQRFMIE